MAAPSQPFSPLLAAFVAALEDGKAEDIVVIDLRQRSTLGDYMVIASGNSGRHIAALAERALEVAKEAGRHSGSEGLRGGDWALVDGGEVILHIFRPEVRAYYDLERLWQSGGEDGMRIDINTGTRAG